MRWLPEVAQLFNPDVELIGARVYDTRGSLIKPVFDHPEELYYANHVGTDLAIADRYAPLLAMSIVDESIPVRQDLLKSTHHSRWMGGRLWDAWLLGRVGYECPELIEAATHDTDEYMREHCVEAIGWMYYHAGAGCVADRMLNDNSMWVRRKAAGMIGLIGDHSHIGLIRDTIDDALVRIVNWESEGYPFNGDDPAEKKKMEHANLLLHNAIISLYKLDPKHGRDAYIQSVGTNSNSARHYAKRAFNRCDWKVE